MEATARNSSFAHELQSLATQNGRLVEHLLEGVLQLAYQMGGVHGRIIPELAGFLSLTDRSLLAEIACKDISLTTIDINRLRSANGGADPYGYQVWANPSYATLGLGSGTSFNKMTFRTPNSVKNKWRKY